jgi:hypothetical protein
MDVHVPFGWPGRSCIAGRAGYAWYMCHMRIFPGDWHLVMN